MPSAPKIRVRMYARPIDEPHRASSNLELLFDLTFVVAIAAATAQLAHSIAGGQVVSGLVPFLEVFFAIWWAWMNFTWFASSYDTDDVAYRLLTIVQMGGVLVLAAGVPAAARDSDYSAVALGYIIMRIGLVTQWVRAGIEYRAGRRTAFRYAAGLVSTQLGWVIRIVLTNVGALPPSAQVPTFAALVVAELAVPRWAERAGSTSWHPHHIAERYGLFTIILLGESVLAASTGVQSALARASVSGSLVGVATAGFLLVCALWWLYFLEPAGEGLAERRHGSYLWGYGHYVLFASLAALGSGLDVVVERTTHALKVSPVVAGYAVAAPAGLFVLLLWMVHRPIVAHSLLRPAVTLIAVAAIFAAPLGARQIGVPAVVAIVAAVSTLLIVDALYRRVQLDLWPQASDDLGPELSVVVAQGDEPGG